MKKILFATTALVATASVAAADVSFSGYGRFGAMTTSDAPGADGIMNTADDTGSVSGIYSRIRLQIDMTTEADNGLTFGARLRAEADSFPQEVGNSGGAPTFNAPRFWASTGGFTVSVGNIVGAIEAMPGTYANSQSSGTGLSGLGFLDLVPNVNGVGTWDSYSSKGQGAATQNGVEIMYSAGAFTGHISYSNGERTYGTFSSGSNEGRLAAYVAYAFNDWTVAAGINESDLDGESFYMLTVGGKVGNVDLSLGYAHRDETDDDRITLRAGADVGAATRVYGYITQSDNVINTDSAGDFASFASEDMSYGIGVSHNLGGGASLEAGVVRDYNEETRADMGIRFNF